MAAKKIIVLTSWLSALILLAPSDFAQSVEVNGLVCQILAADCSTIVSVQASSMSIALKSKGYYAICNAILPSNAFAPSDEKQVKCNFQNTGQNCIIGPSQDGQLFFDYQKFKRPDQHRNNDIGWHPVYNDQFGFNGRLARDYSA
jgi:hypothetical protein